MTLHLVSLPEHAKTPPERHVAARLSEQRLYPSGYEQPIGPTHDIWSRQDERATRTQNPSHFAEQRVGVGHVLNDLAKDRNVELAVRRWQGDGDVSRPVLRVSSKYVLASIHTDQSCSGTESHLSE